MPTGHIVIELCGDTITGAFAPGFRCDLYAALTTAGIDFSYVGNANSGCTQGGTSALNDGWPGYTVENLQNVLVPSNLGGGGGAFRNPTLACIMSGTYDCSPGDVTVTSNDAAQNNVLGLLVTLFSAFSGTSFALFKIPPMDDALFPGASARVASFNASLVDTVAAACKLGLNVHLYDPGLLLSDISGDGITPNVGGFAKLTNAYLSAVEEFVASTPPFRPNPLLGVSP